MNFLLKVLLLCFLCIPLSYGDDISKWNEQSLTEWVDKYPTSTINGKRKSILSEEYIKTILQKTIPPAELKKLNKYDVVTPIEKIDHYLIVNKCMAPNCPAELAMVVIGLKAPVIWVGFFEREEIKKMFLSRHGVGI